MTHGVCRGTQPPKLPENVFVTPNVRDREIYLDVFREHDSPATITFDEALALAEHLLNIVRLSPAAS